MLSDRARISCTYDSFVSYLKILRSVRWKPREAMIKIGLAASLFVGESRYLMIGDAPESNSGRLFGVVNFSSRMSVQGSGKNLEKGGT